MNTLADLSSSGSEASLLNNQMKKIFEIEIGDWKTRSGQGRRSEGEERI